MFRITSYWFIMLLAALLVIIPYVGEMITGADDPTNLLSYCGLIFNSILTFAVGFFGYLTDRRQK